MITTILRNFRNRFILLKQPDLNEPQIQLMLLSSGQSRQRLSNKQSVLLQTEVNTFIPSWFFFFITTLDWNEH